MIDLDFLAIGIATFLFCLIRIVWFSPHLFGQIEFESLPINRRINGVLGTLVIGFVIAYFLAFFEGYLHVSSISDGMFVGLCIWIGFVIPTALSSFVRFGRSYRQFFIDCGVNLLSLVVMGGILGA